MTVAPDSAGQLGRVLIFFAMRVQDSLDEKNFCATKAQQASVCVCILEDSFNFLRANMLRGETFFPG